MNIEKNKILEITTARALSEESMSIPQDQAAEEEDTVTLNWADDEEDTVSMLSSKVSSLNLDRNQADVERNLEEDEVLVPQESLDPLTSITLFYDLEVTRMPGLYHSLEPIIHHPEEEIPEFGEHVSIEMKSGKYYWSIESKAVEERMSATSIQSTMPGFELRTARHDLISESLRLGNTDRRLDSIFKSEDDGSDHLTPDFLITDPDGIVHCIEVTSIMSSDQDELERAFHKKSFKYRNALMLRATERPVTYTVIVVSSESVLSNVPLSHKLITDMIIRFRVISAVEEAGRAKGLQIFQSDIEEKLNKLSSTIKSEIESIEIDNSLSKDWEVTSEFINRALDQVDNIQVHEAFMTSLKSVPVKDRQFGLKDGKSARVREMEERKEKAESQLQNFWSKYRLKVTDATEKLKPVLNLPACLPSRSDPSTEVRFQSIIAREIESRTKNGDLVDMWKEAFSKISKDEKWLEMSEKELEKEALISGADRLATLEKTRKARRKLRSRVTLKSITDKRVKDMLAADGIKGKVTRNEKWRKERLKDQRKPLSLTTYTGDIADFIDSTHFLEPSGRGSDRQTEIIKPLLEESQRIAGNDSKGSEFIDQWSTTLLFEYCQFVSELAAELTLSARQFCNKGELLLKKLRNYHCYLLVSPSGKKNPIGLSIYIPKAIDAKVLRWLPGRPMIEFTNGFMMHFTTIAPDKLNNMYTASSMILSLVSFLSYMEGCDAMAPDNFKTNRNMRRMLNTLFLLRLEDKAETEESVTMTRYMYMECLKSPNVTNCPDPFKMLSKVNTRPRSRLNVYLIKLIMDHFYTMTVNCPRRSLITEGGGSQVLEDNDPLPADSWDHLINFFTGCQMKSASRVLNICYVGYLKNKDAMTQGNTSWKLLEKVIEEDSKARWDGYPGSKGDQSPFEIPSSHSFNLECVKAASKTVEDRLKTKFGDTWKETVAIKTYNELARLNSFNLASLKASSLTTDEDVSRPVCPKSIGPTKRRKMLEAVADNLDLYGINPFCKFSKFVRKRMRGSKKARADLFKKQQHGGLREIYVMDEVTRVFQLFVETLARSICSEFEEESITNPKRKLHNMNNHYRKSRLYAAKEDLFPINLNSSSDKTRWNQGFIIRCLTIPLFRCTPKEMHGAIQCVANMWVEKHIKIPPEVIELLRKDTRLSSDSYDRLRLEFHGKYKPQPGQALLMPRKGLSFLTLRTGFMQGIWHVVSSLLHLGYALLCKQMVTSVIKKYSPGSEVLITTGVSSDDSKFMLTVFIRKDEKWFSLESIRLMYFMERLLYSLEVFCLFFSMRSSVKSTVAMPDSVEFNSEFIFNNTLAVPVIKFVAASLNAIPYESFSDKFNGSYNLISDLSASGLPFFNTHLCQLAQGFHHYKTLGLGLTPLDTKVAELLLEAKDPNYGFWLMDSQLLTGVMGFPFCRYMLYSKTGLLPVTGKVQNQAALQVDSSGCVSESLQILHGDRMKQKRLVSQLLLKGDYISKRSPAFSEDSAVAQEGLQKVMITARDLVNSHFRILYEQAENEDDLLLKLCMKALMPGVAKSLTVNNVHMQTVAASIYSAHTACVTMVRDVRPDNPLLRLDYKDRNRTKTSLLLALRIRNRDELTTKDDASYLIPICFPQKERYEDALSVISTYKQVSEVPCPRLRCQKNRISITPNESRLPASLLSIVKKLWFGHDCKLSRTLFGRCLSAYRQLFPWILDTHNESLSKSPFDSAIEMFGFINSCQEAGRTVNLIGPSANSTRFTTQISLLIAKNYRQNIILRRPCHTKVKQGIRGSSQNKLDLSLMIAQKSERESLVSKILEGEDILPPGEFPLNRTQKRLASLQIIQGWAKGKIDVLELQSIIKETKLSPQLFYLKEQRKIVDHSGAISWDGDGEALMHVGDDLIIFKLKDAHVTEIRAKTLESFKRNILHFKNAMQQLGVKPVMEHHKSGIVAATFDGERLNHPKTKGCPFLIQRTIEKTLADLKGVKHTIERGVLRLTYDMSRSRRCTLLSYRVRSSDVELDSCNDSEQNLWEAWVNGCSWDQDSALQTLKDLKESMESLSTNSQLRWRRTRETDKLLKEATELKDFLSLSFRQRIGYRRLTLFDNTDIMSSVKYDDVQAEFDEIFTDELLEELGDPYGECTEGLFSICEVKPHEDEPGPADAIEEFREEFLDLIRNTETDDDYSTKDLHKLAAFVSEDLGDSPLTHYIMTAAERDQKALESELIHKPGSIYSSHPLWDDFSDFLDSKSKRILDGAFMGVLKKGEEELGRIVMWLLERKEVSEGDQGKDKVVKYVNPLIDAMKRFLGEAPDSTTGSGGITGDSDGTGDSSED
ncbi:L protein [Browner virus]|uniref:RNA-directed RNA polymerase L n=1 Tax=Browner virus TaxID=2600347 RepID=A0A5B8XA01_9VIRU|nr:L protein [Browner virus]QED21534.1 L protein [Browner virus]